MRITDLPELSAADLAENDVVAVDHDTGNGIETKKITWKNLLNKIYPVGSLYMSAKATSPANLFGGTWEQIKDRFLLAAGDTYAAGSTGGEAAVALTESQLPKHRFDVMDYNGSRVGNTRNGEGKSELFLYQQSYSTVGSSNYLVTNYIGQDASHNNMPPYQTVYVWKRTA